MQPGDRGTQLGRQHLLSKFTGHCFREMHTWTTPRLSPEWPPRLCRSLLWQQPGLGRSPTFSASLVLLYCSTLIMPLDGLVYMGFGGAGSVFNRLKHDRPSQNSCSDWNIFWSSWNCERVFIRSGLYALHGTKHAHISSDHPREANILAVRPI